MKKDKKIILIKQEKDILKFNINYFSSEPIVDCYGSYEDLHKIKNSKYKSQ